MEMTEIGTLADDILAVIGRDAAFFRHATTDDVGDLLHTIAQATDAPAEASDHAWRVWRTDDWYRHTCSVPDRKRALHEIHRQLEHDQAALFIGRWKNMAHLQELN